MITSIISNNIVIYQNYKYNNLYKGINEVTGRGIIVDNPQEKDNINQYKIKIININNENKFKATYLLINIDKEEKLEFGDEISFSGKFIEPTRRRNYEGFDYKEYLETIKVYGTVNVNKAKVIQKNKLNYLRICINKCVLKFSKIIDSKLDNEYAELVKGMLLGKIANIDENTKENFRSSNISHVLAISGMHISYIVMGINIILKKLLGKNKTKICIIFILVIYMTMTGFSPSIVRASITEILILIGSMIYRKEDIATSLSLSLLLILIYNPYLITNISLQFSYIGTIGIIYLHKNILAILQNAKVKHITNKRWGKILNTIKEVLAVTISTQLAILPLSIYHFNIFSTYFVITNLIVNIIIGPIIILGIITVILSTINNFISMFFLIPLKILVNILIITSKIGTLPFSKIYIKTPSIYIISLYYIVIILFNICYEVYSSKEINVTQKRIRNLIALAKYKLKPYKKVGLKVILSMILILIIVGNRSKSLKINFIDVGQGDSTFIVTPKGKTILIDGGGSISPEYDVGKNTLLPYILDRGFTKIDYIFISHFDQDHVGGILYLLNEIKVKDVIIGKQFESSENYLKFLEIVKQKKLNVKVIENRTKIEIEKDLYFDILWPNSLLKISENSINNNALVCKLNYNKFSMLFTGDIEEEAENALTAKYNKTNILKSTILKVGHHGSKTSSTQEFLKLVDPKIALIGVGKNNIYGHPSEEVIERLKNYSLKLYRTDESGEISININNKCINLTKQEKIK